MDRKALKREYKETQRPAGVFRVRNTVHDKSFIGASVDLPNELGPDAFEFETLDTLAPRDEPDYRPKDDLKALEELWLERLAPFGERGYNIKPKPGS